MLVQIKFFRYLIALSLSLLAIIVSPYANANALLLPMSPKELKNSSFSEYLETFKDVVEFNYSVASKIAPHMPIEDLVVGNTYFLPFGVHSPGQPNIDFFSGRQKNIQAISSGAVSWRPKKKGYRLKNRGYGKYVYGLRDAAKGIVVGDKVFLHDGNTRGLSSLYLGATHMAIKITGKYPDPSIEHIIPKKEQVIENPEFRDYLASLGKLMLWDANAEKIEELPSWVSVTDNPWRALSVIHRLKVRTLYTGRKQTIKSIRITDKEPNIPAAAYVKLNGEPDFIEVLMGMALKIGGFQLSSIDLENYDPSFDDTAYFKHCLQRGLRTHHEAWEVLKALEIANVPYIPQHLVLTSSKDVLQLLRSHHRTLQFEEKCLAALAEKPKKKSK